MDRSAPKHSSRARRAAPGHHDPVSESAGVTAAEIRDGLVLAFLARKRLLVLVGDAGSGRPALFRQLVEHVEADGAMALPVAASVGSEVEDLVAAAGTGALPDLVPGEDGETDFDTLIAALEERLELAGSGLLAVDNAAVLAPPVLADLVDLTRAETPAGRFMQVLLCGTPELEGTLARAGLTDELRDMGVIYRMTAGDFVDDVREPAPALQPVSRPAPLPGPMLAVPPQPQPQQAPVQSAAIPPANDWSVGQRRENPPQETWQQDERWEGQGWSPDGGQAGAVRAPRRTALYAGAALTTLVLLGAAGAAIATAVPGAFPDRALAMVEEGWAKARDAVERTVQGLTGATAPAERQHAVTVPVAPAADATASAAVAPSTASTAPTTQTAVQAPAAPPTAGTQTVSKPAPPASTTVPPAAAPIETAALPPAQAQPSAAKASSTGNTEAAPGVASLPPLEDPSTTAAVPAAPAAPDADTALRVRTMVDQARRQIAGKRLTTPPGDNAYETVQRIRQIAPSSPEVAELLTTMTDTYRRWAMLAERDGDWSETKRFYERAQMISPESPDLAERIRAASEQRVYTGPSVGPASGTAIGTAGGTAPGSSAAPVKATPGLGDRESVLALLRNPAELSRTLQAGASADTRLDNGKTLLMIAAEQGLADAVRVLLDRHARTDLRTSDGATAVMYAAWGGHDGVVRALAEGGADLDTTNSDGKTALMAAAARGHQEVARTLIQRGVMVDRTTAYGWSALMYAANNGHEAVAKLLLDSGANPYRMDANGNSALTLGALQGHVQVVEALKPR
ncbi:ankyrin repeat domain-containing protein [Azospirillum sp. TSH64]|uniref:ankyrin repeat domain-containing protein n=1 Tax=Azospirillum sp. TSH64 TaxID=652740 RepID=UPI000D691B41|nr:ankyrin repeat domain-containing protein [Azospirillum sp. TSH64]